MHNISGVPRRPVVLVILDGFGVNPSKRNNGVAEAHTPQLDAYFSRFPHATLNASGHAVGLPDGQMGNSEVGHLTLGAGNVILQDSVKINEAISDGSFNINQALMLAIEKAHINKRPLHLMGLVSDGGVHSNLDHLKAIIRLARDHGVKPLLHMITDGRDTPPKSALYHLSDIESLLHECAAGDSDEFIQPVLLPSFTTVLQDDPFIFFNFRKDRPRQIVAALADANFKGFDRGEAPLADVTCMMPYDRSMKLPYAFEPEKPGTTLAQLVSSYGLAQFHCAETEKYAHVTYFFNGGRTSPYAGEKQLLIPSPGVATYDQKPSMSAKEVADAVVGAISKGSYAFIVVNFANGDMVGHTANRHAVLEAVETLDREVSRVLEAAETAGYSVVLTADHGNCEELVDPFTGEPHTQHTTYPVPCMILDEANWQLSSAGGLANVAPTILQLMGLKSAEQMADSLLLRELPGKRSRQRHGPRRLRVA